MVTSPNPQGDTGDEGLLAAARRGDDAAFARLLERHDPLFRRMVGVLVDHRDTERVLSEAYVKAYRAVGRARGDAVTWLGRACYLTALDELRRRERRRTGGPGRKPLTEPSPPTSIPPDQRAVVVLEADLPADAIATVLGTTPATVGRLRSRAEPDAAAVLAVEEEPPSDEFWKGLGARLLAERAAPPAPPPRIERTDSIPEPAGHRDPPLAMQRRPPPATRRTAGPDPVEGLAHGARQQRRRRRRHIDPRILVGVGVVAAIAVALVVVIRLASEAASPVRENSVAEISADVADALDAASFSAAYTRTIPGPDGPERVAYRVTRDRSGSYLVTRDDGLRAVAYDADLGTRWERTVALDGTVLLTEQTGLSAGPPDPSGSDPAVPDGELAAALRALSTVTDREAESTRIDGRDVWRMEAPLERTGAGEPSRVELVVDRARLEPISVRLTDGPRLVRSLRFADVSFDAISPGPLRVDPSGAVPQTVDRGFRRVSLREVAPAVGSRPLRPNFLPPGFELVDTALHEADGIVSLRYQRGVQQVVVTTRPATTGPADPFERPDPVEPDSVDVERGPFRDVEAHQTMTVSPPPALWGQDDAVAFTISGDLTSAQILRMAESMR